MKNKKLNLTQFAKKAAKLSDKEQKSIKGGYKITSFDSMFNPISTKWIEVDIRRPGSEKTASVAFKGGSIFPSRRK